MNLYNTNNNKMQDIHQEIQNAVQVLKEGGVILYPTDTVWGLGCDASNEQAVQRIYEIKQREASKSMIILTNGERMIWSTFNEIPDVAWEIMELSEKPTTLVLDNPKNIAKNLIAEDNSVGMRLVKDPFCVGVMNQLKKPLVSTSANLSGAPTPNSFEQISPEIRQLVDYVVNLHREKPSGTPSTIIKLTRDAQVKIIRK